MGTRLYHLMNDPKNKSEGFVKVALNQWAGMRRKGYEFVTPQEEAEQGIKDQKAADKEQAVKDKEAGKASGFFGSKDKKGEGD